MAKTAADRVFVDTNVLVYARFVSSIRHTEATAALARLVANGAEVWISRQIIREYLAACSRPGTVNPAPTPALLSADVVGFQKRFRVARDNARVTRRLLRLLSTVTCAGRQVYDANIAATMIEHGIPKLLTNNEADFKRFVPDITVDSLV